ncbi:MAG: NRDE family protein, partial [Syntrophomonas sp.]
PQTGVSLAWERLLAPVYVESPDYGTKSTTVILIDRDNYVQFWERSFSPFQSGTWNEVHYDFQVNF